MDFWKWIMGLAASVIITVLIFPSKKLDCHSSAIDFVLCKKKYNFVISFINWCIIYNCRDFYYLRLLFIFCAVHFVKAVGNCGLCMRQCLACSSYAHVVHCTLVITQALRYDVSAKHEIMDKCKLMSLPIWCTGYNFSLTQQGERSISRTCYSHGCCNNHIQLTIYWQLVNVGLLQWLDQSKRNWSCLNAQNLCVHCIQPWVQHITIR